MKETIIFHENDSEIEGGGGNSSFKQKVGKTRTIACKE